MDVRRVAKGMVGGLAVVGVLALLFLPMWLDSITAMLNSDGRLTSAPSRELPLFVAPIIVWAGRQAGRPEAARSEPRCFTGGQQGSSSPCGGAGARWPRVLSAGVLVLQRRLLTIWLG